MKFDPMTGEPIEETADNGSQIQMQEMPQQPPVAPTPSNKGVKVGIIVAAISAVVVLFIVIIALFSGIFMSDKDRVMRAIQNTFEEGSALSETWNEYYKIYEEDEFTSSVYAEYQDASVEMEFRNTKTDKQLWGILDMTGYPEIEGTVTITDGQVQAATPLLNDILFVYNYREKNDGYLMEQLTSDDIKLINQMCEILYNEEYFMTENSDAYDKFVEDVAEWYDTIEVEKLKEKEEFEIDGKDKKCTGYRMYITEDTVIGLLEIYEDFYSEYDMSYTVDGVEVSAEELIDTLMDEVDGMDDLEIDFYLDSNKLAAIVVEVEGDDLEILFLGGDYRAQNIRMEYDGEDIMEIECEMDKDVEEWTLKLSGRDFLTYEYDTKKGDFEGAFLDYYGDSLASIEGTFVSEKGRWAFEDAKFESEGEEIEFSLAIEKGAELETLEGDELDIGEASMSDLQDALSFLY